MYICIHAYCIFHIFHIFHAFHAFRRLPRPSAAFRGLPHLPRPSASSAAFRGLPRPSAAFCSLTRLWPTSATYVTSVTSAAFNGFRSLTRIFTNFPMPSTLVVCLQRLMMHSSSSEASAYSPPSASSMPSTSSTAILVYSLLQYVCPGFDTVFDFRNSIRLGGTSARLRGPEYSAQRSISVARNDLSI